MTFTPSATSSFVAGSVFWGMVWSILVKVDELARLIGFKNTRYGDRMLIWIRQHKILTVSCTEVVNYTVHGITSPLSVTFALGGTLMNILMVFIIVPIVCKFKRLGDLA